MKAKRILSVLLALLMAAGLLGIGASAAWEAPEAEKTLSVMSAGWGYKEISWAVTGEAADFFADLDADEIAYEWLVVNAAGATIAVKAENGLADLPDSTTGNLVLVMTPGKIKNYGEFKVTLNLNGVPSGTVTVTLVDDTALNDAIAAAKAYAANPNGRYTDCFVLQVENAIAVAEGLLGSATMTAAKAEAAVAALKASYATQDYMLTGIGFLDDFLAPRIAGLWGSFDAITTPFRTLQNLNWSSITTLILNTIIAIFTIGY